MDSNFIYDEHQNYQMMQLHLKQLQDTQTTQMAPNMPGVMNTMWSPYTAPSFTQQMWAEHSNFNSFQQQMRSAQEFQSNQLQLAYNNQYTGIVGPSVGFMTGLPQQMLQSQVQGLYSGLGITPETRQLLSQYMVNPVRNQATQTMSLANAFLTATMSRAPLGMSFEQQYYMTNTLAANAASMGTSVLGGAANLAGGAAGLWAGAKVVGSLGFTPLAIGAGTLWAGDKILSSPWGPALTGGKFGGYNSAAYNPFKWPGHIKEEIAEDESLTNFFNTESYRILDPSKQRSPFTLGLTKSETREWTSAIRHWDSKFGISDEEVQSLLATVVDNDLIRGVSDFSEFETKFGEQVKYIRNASKILNKSYQEVADMIAEFKRVGIQPGNFDLKAAELKNYSAILGKSVDAVKNFMLNSVGAFTQNTGLNPELIQEQFLFDSGILQLAYDNASDTGDTDTVNLINNFGGAMGAASAVQSGIQQIFSRQDMATLLSNFYTPLGEGEFAFNQEAFNYIYQGVQEGTIDLRNMGPGMRDWDRTQYVPFLNAAESGQLMMNQDPHTVMRQIKALVGAYKNSEGLEGMSEADVMHTMLGVDYNVATLMDVAMETYETEGPKLEIGTYFNSRRLLSAAEQENMRKDIISGNYRKTTEWLDTLAEKSPLGINFKYTVEDYLQESINKKAGIGSINLVEHTLTGSDYDFNKKAFEDAAKVKVVEEMRYNLALYDFISKHPSITEVPGSIDLGDLMGDGVSVDNFYNVAKAAYEDGRISKWEMLKINNAVNNADNFPSSNMDNVTNSLVWKTLLDSQGNLIDTSNIEGGNELVTRLTSKGVLALKDELTEKEAADIQKVLINSLSLEMKDALAMEDRAHIAAQASTDLYSFIDAFDVDMSKLEAVPGFESITIDTKALTDQQVLFHKTLDKITKEAPRLSEAELGERVDEALQKLVSGMGNAMPGGSDYLAAYFKTKLTEEADYLSPLVDQLSPQAREDFSALRELIDGLKDLDDLPEILQERALFSEKYGTGSAGEEDAKATDLLEQTKTITEKYKETTEMYYDLIEGEIKSLNDRINSIESGKDTSSFLSRLFPWF
jgi:hypothetical protein